MIRTVAVLPLALAAHAHAQQYQWVGGSTGIWDNPANWMPPGNPTGAGVSVLIDSPTLIDLGVLPPIIDRLELASPLASINLGVQRGLLVQQELHSIGSITINAPTTGLPATLVLGDNATLSGAGTTTLLGPAATIAPIGDTTWNLADQHTVRGTGALRSLATIHDAQVRAAGGTLRILSEDLHNDGLVAAEHDGQLRIENTVITQTDRGTIHAGASIVLLDGVRIRGGTLAADTGTFAMPSGLGTVLWNVTLNADFDVLPGKSLALVDYIANQGTITLHGEGPDIAMLIPGGYTVPGPYELRGSGRLVLTGPNAHVLLSFPWLLNGPEHTIEGSGLIQTPLINHGLIHANQPDQIINFQYTGRGNAAIRNWGILQASNRGTLWLDDRTRVYMLGPGQINLDNGSARFSKIGSFSLDYGLVSGGVITARNHSAVDLAEAVLLETTTDLDETTTVTFTHLRMDRVVNRGKLAGPVTTIRNSLANDGSIVITDQLNIQETVELHGTGVLTLGTGPDNPATLIDGQDYNQDTALLINADPHTVAGDFYVPIEFHNHGTISPGTDTAAGAVVGDLVLTRDGSLVCDIGPDILSTDRLELTRPVDGTLRVRYTPDFDTTQTRWRRVLVRSKSADLGRFHTADLPPDTRVAYFPQAIIVGRSCDADMNLDFTADFFDFTQFLTWFESTDPQADLAAPFGSFDFFDISAYLAAYHAGCP
jgi:hypothetical protein